MKADYDKRKEVLRQEAIEWKADFCNHEYTWEELAEIGAYFERMGRRYGLLTEFEENRII